MTSECNEVSELCDLQLWPEEILVRCFCENHKPRFSAGMKEANTPSDDGAGGPEEEADATAKE